MTVPPPGLPGHLATWACHAGDVAFAVTAPAWWLPGQRAYLAEYVTTPPPGELDLAGFAIQVHPSDLAFRQAGEAARAAPGVRVEPVPGLVLLEYALPARRCFLIAEDRVEHEPGAWAVTVAGRSINLFTHSSASRPHRYPVRLIREAMLRTYEDAGGVVFHAAAADVAGGAGVMICGPGGTGKTTTLAALLRPGARLLSNDRVIAHHGDRLVAVPLPVPAARGTIEAFPELGRAARAAAGAAALDGMPAVFGSRVKFSFTAGQFAAALGAGLASAAVLRLVVIPRLSESSEPARLRRLSRPRARQLLTASCFTPRDEFWTRPWLVPRRSPDSQLQAQAAAAVGHIAARVPCIELRFGVHAPVADLAAALERAIEGRLP